MNKTSQTLITIAIVLAGAMLASAVMVKFTPNSFVAGVYRVDNLLCCTSSTVSIYSVSPK
jgi:hypothetical protein